MDFRSLPFAAILLIIAAPAATAQPNQMTCNGASCTFTLTFADPQGAISGAPYSGQASINQVLILRDGTHTSFQRTSTLTYRDSQGRTRTEQSAYPTGPDGQARRPGDFTVIEIHDPLAGFEYILDPVTHTAHRMAFDFGEPYKWDASRPGQLIASTEKDTRGITHTYQPLGTRTISGVATFGHRVTTGENSDEYWTDPKTGISLITKITYDTGEITTTLLHYSNAEPDPALFRIPEGYQTIDETGPFKVVHQQTTPGSVSMSQGPQFDIACGDQTCTITYDPGTPRTLVASNGAAYSGQEIMETAAQTLPNGRQIPARTNTLPATFRDANGNIRTERHVSAPGLNGLGVIAPDIQDSVHGYQYILDSVNHVAYRLPLKINVRPFQSNAFAGQPVGTHPGPNGSTVADEDLGAQPMFGVSALGHKTTWTYPPGTYHANDKTVTNIDERWIDPNTGIVLLTKASGSNQNTTRSIPDYKAGDPDPALFQIPAEYKIVDETGKFSYTIPRSATTRIFAE